MLKKNQFTSMGAWYFPAIGMIKLPTIGINETGAICLSWNFSDQIFLVKISKVNPSCMATPVIQTINDNDDEKSINKTASKSKLIGTVAKKFICSGCWNSAFTLSKWRSDWYPNNKMLIPNMISDRNKKIVDMSWPRSYISSTFLITTVTAIYPITLANNAME